MKIRVPEHCYTRPKEPDEEWYFYIQNGIAYYDYFKNGIYQNTQAMKNLDNYPAIFLHSIYNKKIAKLLI